MHPFSTTWKHQKTVSFHEIEKGCIGKKWVNCYIYINRLNVGSQNALFPISHYFFTEKQRKSFMQGHYDRKDTFGIVKLLCIPLSFLKNKYAIGTYVSR